MDSRMDAYQIFKTAEDADQFWALLQHRGVPVQRPKPIVTTDGKTKGWVVLYSSINQKRGE